MGDGGLLNPTIVSLHVWKLETKRCDVTIGEVVRSRRDGSMRHSRAGAMRE